MSAISQSGAAGSGKKGGGGFHPLAGAPRRALSLNAKTPESIAKYDKQDGHHFLERKEGGKVGKEKEGEGGAPDRTYGGPDCFEVIH